MPNATENYKRLYGIASNQNGFFTTKQAIEAGYYSNSHSFHQKRGNWIREHRGIYRLAAFPLGERPDLTLWYLWSRDRKEEPRGVYSHATALAIHELSDVNPKRLHMTVPKKFRRNSPIPKVLELHFGLINSTDILDFHGVRVTTPMKTIIDVVEEGNLPEEILRQAVFEALDRGMVTRSNLEKLHNSKLKPLMTGIDP